MTPPAADRRHRAEEHAAMPASVNDPAVQQAIASARQGGGTLFPSPEDWRDLPIYFLLVDRFNNPAAPPRNLPFDAEFASFQGGTYAGVQAQLPYIKALGFGALWLSPVLQNPAFDQSAYHGYGIQDFLAVEPRFASAPGQQEAELAQLIDAAHALGLYIILDIVLHHAGNVFAYQLPGAAGAAATADELDWQQAVQPILWRAADGSPTISDPSAGLPAGAAVSPSELRADVNFTRCGNANSPGAQPAGDFDTLKGFCFTPSPAGPWLPQDVLIRCYQYIIAKFDVDGFRIDTLKYIPPDFERIFANAMREFALSAGKKNFFTFGEIYDDEQTISAFIGRDTVATSEPVGVDAALDYPLFYQLPNMIKGLGPTPADVAQVFETRKLVEAPILTSHGEAGQYFVSFLDNHDQAQRFGYTGPVQLDAQIAMGLAVLYCLPGIPCVYYGTEQGLSGHKTAQQSDDSMVREALWGKPDGFDVAHPLCVALQAIGAVRQQQAALRYGRYYFRPLSGDGVNFGLCAFPTGVLAFSRILNDQEVVVVANTDPLTAFAGGVVVDIAINAADPPYTVLYSNLGPAGAATPSVQLHAQGSVTITEVDGTQSSGPLRTLAISLQPNEVQILAAGS
jgi:glycosidase